MSQVQKGQADVLLTPEMIHAGSRILADAFDLGRWAAEDTAKEVFEVMQAASAPSEPSAPTSGP
jgi:hypothetical protein